jgi:hypothetical protein
MSNENKFPLETLSLRAKLYESKGLTLVINTVRVHQNVQTSRNQPTRDSYDAFESRCNSNLFRWQLLLYT